MVTASTSEELKKEIVDEVLSLGTVMEVLYSKFGIVHKAVIHLNGWKQWCARRARIFSNVHVVVNYMQTWMMRSKGAPLHFPKMMNPRAIELKAHIWCQIQNYEELPQLITSLQASHACVFKSMDVVVHTHAIPSIGNLTQVKIKEHVSLELDSYFDELMCRATSPNLLISVETMHKYVAGLAALKRMMHMLLDKLDRGARAVYLDAMEARFRFQKDVTLDYTDTFDTVDHREDVEELDFPGLSES